ncbi:hypothetical protein E4U41_001250 [Claviceps citrina]|nr:hypothetical protein E4U41_001250 [Claviceps citrina]
MAKNRSKKGVRTANPHDGEALAAAWRRPVDDTPDSVTKQETTVGDTASSQPAAGHASVHDTPDFVFDSQTTEDEQAAAWPAPVDDTPEFVCDNDQEAAWPAPVDTTPESVANAENNQGENDAQQPEENLPTQGDQLRRLFLGPTGGKAVLFQRMPNNTFLPFTGHHPDYLRRCGQSAAPGIHVIGEVLINDFVPDYFTLTMQVVHGTGLNRVISLQIPLAGTKVVTNLFQTDDTGESSELLELLPTSPPWSLDLLPSSSAQVFPKHEDIAPDAPDARYLSTTTKEVCLVRITIPTEGITIIRHKRFWGSPLLDDREKLKPLIDNFLQSTREDDTTKLFMLVIPPEQWEKNFVADFFSTDAGKAPLYERILLGSQTFERLDFKSCVIDGLPRPQRPAPAFTYFHDLQHYTVTQVFGARDAAYLDEILITVGRITPLECNIVPLPHSEWKTSEDDKQLAGVEPDGLAMEYLVIVPFDEKAQLFMPDINEPVEMVFNFEQRNHALPSLASDANLQCPAKRQMNIRTLTVPTSLTIAQDNVHWNYNVAKTRQTMTTRHVLRHILTPENSLFKIALWTEADAIRYMNNLARSSARYLWFQWQTNFRTNFPAEALVNWFTVFPNLGHAMEGNYFSEAEKILLRPLEQSRGGVSAIFGAPGTGKTTFAMKLMRAIARPLDTDAAPSIKGKERTDAVVFSNASIPIPTSFVKPKSSKDTPKQTHTGPEPIHIVFSGEQNVQLDDALRRYIPLSTKIVRIFSFKTELKCVFLPPVEPDLVQISKDDTEFDKSCIQSRNNARTQRYITRNPAMSTFSLSNLIREEANADPVTWHEVLSGMKIAASDPANFKARRSTFEAAARLLAGDILHKSEVVFCTPVVAREIANHFSHWRPQLVIGDEAGRLSEGLSMTLTSCWANACVLFVGDPFQFGPVSSTLKANFERTGPEDTIISYRDVFGPQRAISLLYRMHNADVLDIYLTKSSEERKSGTTYYNMGSAFLVISLLRWIALQNFANVEDQRNNLPEAGIRKASILVITPYKGQQTRLRMLLEEMSHFEICKDLVDIRLPLASQATPSETTSPPHAHNSSKSTLAIQKSSLNCVDTILYISFSNGMKNLTPSSTSLATRNSVSNVTDMGMINQIVQFETHMSLSANFVLKVIEAITVLRPALKSIHSKRRSQQTNGLIA